MLGKAFLSEFPHILMIDKKKGNKTNISHSCTLNSNFQPVTFFSFTQALRLSSTARKQTTMGQVVNLMSVDAHRIREMYAYSTLLWTVPIMITLALFFLWRTIGVSCLAGLGVLLVFIPLNAVFLARRAYSLQVGLI